MLLNAITFSSVKGQLEWAVTKALSNLWCFPALCEEDMRQRL